MTEPQLNHSDIDQPDNYQLPKLKTKEQLNKIIVNKNSSPDYLAINIYYDTLRSWYSPKKIYERDGNVLYIKKLYTQGIYLNYKKLGKIHGCSAETVRKKFVKLERLGLIHRSFQHRSNSTTNSYNQLIIYVWRKTPHFFNPCGIDREEIKTLNPQTNHEYIEKKHGVVFDTQPIQNNPSKERGGIHTREDTKELNELISNEIRSNEYQPTFFEKSVSLESKNAKKLIKSDRAVSGNKNIQVGTENVQTPSSPSLSESDAAIQKEPADIIKTSFQFYQKPKTLADMYPILKQDYFVVQSASGREFSLNAMNEILLFMSKKPELKLRSFNSKAGFIAYMTIVFRYEKRDAVKTSNDNFKIRANQTEEDKLFQVQEKFLSDIEEAAIMHVCPENQLRAKLANTLASSKSYNLLSSLKEFKLVKNTMQVHLNKHIDFTENDMDIILSQVKATHEQVFGDGNYVLIEKVDLMMPENGISNNTRGLKETNYFLKLRKAGLLSQHKDNFSS